MRVAAIDQGTTSTRCLVIEDGGTWHLAASRRHAQHHPAPGWVEHDPKELLRNIKAVLRAAGPVDAIALANQGESCLAWDARPARPSPPSLSGKTPAPPPPSPPCRPRPKPSPARSAASPSTPISPPPNWPGPSPSPPSHRPIAAGRLRLGTTDAWFLDRLTGTFATDRATASRTGLMDLSTGDWSPDLFALHGVPLACLPKIRDVDAGFGAIDGTPVKVSLVDQQAALYGHGCRTPGQGKITFGTGAFLLAVAGPNRPDTPLLPTVAWSRSGHTAFAIEGGVYDAGAAVDWARRIGLFRSHAELAAFDRPSAISRGLAFVPALTGLAAPFWDRRAAPLFIGMTPTTDRRDLTQAVLEGIALLTATLLDAAPEVTTVSIDGGLSQSPYFAQFLASASNRTITVPAMHELTALGLAELCGLNVAAIRAGATVFTPDGSIGRQDRDRFADALQRSRAWR